MGMVEDSFRELFPEKSMNYDFSVKYSGRFNGYNANVRQRGNKITFNLSRNWRSVSRDIKMGLLQELLAKLFSEKTTTQNIELYHIFMKKVHIAVPKTSSEPEIEESFNRVNDAFFAGMVEMPNLKWNKSSRKLGSYDYGSDTITISLMLKDAEREIFDYVMYHEILHKKHKFSSKEGQLRYHTKEFRSMEKSFPNSERIEQKLGLLVQRNSSLRKRKPSGIFRFFLSLS